MVVAASVNVLIDLTGASTTTSVHQMRDRSLRLDPTLPRKVADNWDVVCVAPDHPKGAADYARFVRKHRSYDALTPEGEVESGVSHVDARLSPYGPPPAGVFPTINASLIARVSRRDEVYDLWGVGKPYENRTTPTVHVHFGRSMGIPAQRLVRASDHTPPRFRARLFGVVGSALTAGFACTIASTAAVGMSIGMALAVAGVLWIAGTATVYLRRFDASEALEDFGAAVAEGLQRAGLISPSLGADAVRRGSLRRHDPDAHALDLTGSRNSCWADGEAQSPLARSTMMHIQGAAPQAKYAPELQCRSGTYLINVALFLRIGRSGSTP